MVDLHVHSNKSDGTFSPRELVDYAHQKGLNAFALTDHDTIDGVNEAKEYAKVNYPELEVIPGVELSTEYNGRDVHIVGLYINVNSPTLTEHLQQFIDSRELRNEKMCALLRDHGFDITYDALKEAFPGAIITRAHYARYMLNKGYIKSIKEAFERYVGDHCPCFVPREKVTPSQAVNLILEAGGVPVLAHPILYGFGNEHLDLLVSTLKEQGLVGIEAIYSTYTPADERQIRSLAEKYNLLLSGGSDFHGENKPGLDLATGYGKLYIHDDILEKIKEKADQ